MARDFLKNNPQSDDALMHLAHSILMRRAQGARNEAIEVLDKILNDKEGNMLFALNLVAADGATNAETRLDAANRILKHPLSGFNNHLAARRVQWQLRPALRDEIIKDVIATTDQTDPSQLAETARFLIQRDASEQVTELLDLTKAKERRDFTLIWLDAFSKLERWDEVERALKEEDLPLEPFFKKLFLFRISLDQGKNTEADALWNELLAPGPQFEDRLRTAAEYVLKLRRFDYARKAYKLMPPDSQIPRTNFIGMIEVAKGEHKLDEVIMLLGLLVEHVPNDASAANDYNYYRLLKNADLNQAVLDAIKLYKSNKRVLDYRVTYALAFYRDNQFKEAHLLLNTKDVDWEGFKIISRKVVRAATLIKVGHTAEAQKLIDTINLSKLMAEEKILLAPLVK